MRWGGKLEEISRSPAKIRRGLLGGGSSKKEKNQGDEGGGRTGRRSRENSAARLPWPTMNYKDVNQTKTEKNGGVPQTFSSGGSPLQTSSAKN